MMSAEPNDSGNLQNQQADARPLTASPKRKRLGLFDAFGVELEYMIVDQDSLNVCAVTDRLIQAECGHIESEINLGRLSWSNELALHVVELKTSSPEASLSGLADEFHQHVQRINQHLAVSQPTARLMHSAMHPWMNPDLEMQLWPHDYSVVYEAYNRIFDCRGHGWANLQSVHLNLPFDGDDQFGRLHAAIRLILPLLPGLAASSPVMNGQLTGLLDNRLQVYQGNSARIPSLAGQVIPEPVFTEADYRQQIFQPMFDDIAPLDPDGVLQDEFLNSRGAIARFDRGSIEIRVIDIQECPAADLAILQTTVAVLKALCNEQWSTLRQQQQVAVPPLYQIFSDSIRDADHAIIRDASYLSLFGYGEANATVGQLWHHLVKATCPPLDAGSTHALDVILQQGPLARRLQQQLQPNAPRATKVFSVESSVMRHTYERLCECLQHNVVFEPESKL